MGRKALVDKEYLKSDVWKCGKSPTGAHHWKETQSGIFYCKHCYDVRKFPVDYKQASNI